MPKIQEYQSGSDIQSPIPQRQNISVDGGLSSAIQEFGGTVRWLGKELEQREAQAEVSRLNAQMADAHARFTVDLDETAKTADPNDREMAPKFLQRYDDYMGEIGSNISTDAGQKYFQEANARQRSHFVESAYQYHSALAGEQARSDFQTVLNSYSSSLVSNPAAFDSTREQFDTSVNALVQTGSLPAGDAVKLRSHGLQHLATSTIKGWVNLNPDYAKQELNSGRWDQYFTGDTKAGLIGEANQALHAQEVEANRQETERQRLIKEQQTAQQNQFLQRMADNKLTTKDILNSGLDPFGSGSKEQFIQLLKTSQNDKLKTEAGTYTNLFQRIHLPDGDPKKIRDENDLNYYLGRGLDMTGLNQLRSEVQGRKTVDGQIEGELKKGLVDVAKGTLTHSNPLLGIRDPSGEEQYQKWLSYFLTEYSAKRKAGKSPTDLLNPDSPDYLGKSIRQFVRSPNQVLGDMVRDSALEDPVSAAPDTKAAPSSVPKRLPSETISDYLKRVRKPDQGK